MPRGRTQNVFISPTLHDPVEVLQTLAHELIHYADFRIMPRLSTRTISGHARPVHDVGIIPLMFSAK